jgi:hypothetical protein
MENQNSIEIVLAIPGGWLNRLEIVTSIAKKSQGYLFAGETITHLNNRQSFDLEIANHNTGLCQAFALAGRGDFSDQDLKRLARHTFTLYAIGPGGSLEAARSIMNLAAGLLRSGGIAVKVDSSGLAHNAERWLNYVRYKDSELTALYDAYVLIATSGNTLYSCGMHNLGYPDAIAEISESPDETAHLLQTFLLYLLHETPQLRDGNSFSVSAATPHYRLKMENCTIYSPGALFYNPFGRWRLSRL